MVAVDDEVSNSPIKKILRKYSCEILDSANGEKPGKEHVLMDFKIPLTNRRDAVRGNREFNRKVINIAQSANAFAEVRQKAIEAGCDGCITKPADLRLLKEPVIRNFNV